MKPQWPTRAYRKGDEAGIYELWGAVYPSEKQDRGRWMEWWHWLYEENPAGKGVIWLAESHGRIIAQDALVPVKFKVGSQIVLGALGVDAMTHPDFRRQGLFEAINRGLAADAARFGIELAIGFPSRYSYPGLTRKSGWYDVARMKVLFKPHHWKNTIRFKINNPLLSNVLSAGAVASGKVMRRTRALPVPDLTAVTRIDSFDERFDRLWLRTSRQHEIMVVRDRDYLNWRYRAPDKDYQIFAAQRDNEITGYLVARNMVIKGFSVSSIFALTGESEAVMCQLVSQAVKSSQQAGMDFMVYSFIANGSYNSVLKRCGFIGAPFLRGGHFCIYSGGTQFPGAFLQNPRNWLVQIEDSDTL
jgi:hypothetical protein